MITRDVVTRKGWTCDGCGRAMAAGTTAHHRHAGRWLATGMGPVHADYVARLCDGCLRGDDLDPAAFWARGDELLERAKTPAPPAAELPERGA